MGDLLMILVMMNYDDDDDDDDETYDSIETFCDDILFL